MAKVTLSHVLTVTEEVELPQKCPGCGQESNLWTAYEHDPVEKTIGTMTDGTTRSWGSSHYVDEEPKLLQVNCPNCSYFLIENKSATLKLENPQLVSASIDFIRGLKDG